MTIIKALQFFYLVNYLDIKNYFDICTVCRHKTI